MLFKDIIEGRYRVFARMKEEERTRNIGVVKYIDLLASMAGVDIQLWDAHSLFSEGTGNKLIDGKNEINRRFFQEVDRLIASTPSTDIESDSFTDEMKAAIKAAENRHVSSLIATEQARSEREMRNAMTSYSDYTRYVKLAAEANADVRRLSGQGSNIEEQVRQVHASAFWKFTGFTNNSKLRFRTKSDIVLNHRNLAAGVDITINFGRFEAVFNVSDFSLRAFGVERNVLVRGYPHPHIQGSAGGICWGSATTAASLALAKCNFVEPLTLLATVLSSYNKESPYVSMEAFQDQIGVPEELLAIDAVNDAAAASQVRFAEIDTLDHNVTTRRPGNNTTPPRRPLAVTWPGDNDNTTTTNRAVGPDTSNIEF